MQEKTIGEKIREYRQKQGLTQDALAAELHVSSQAVSKWENGLTMPDINLLVPLSKVLKIGLNDLLGTDRRAEFEHKWQKMIPYEGELTLLVAEEALKEFPDDETFLYRRACDCFFLGESRNDENYLTRACIYFSDLHRLYPENDCYLSFLARAEFARGNRDRALDYAYKIKDPKVRNSLIPDILGGDEKIRKNQNHLFNKFVDLFNNLMKVNTRESINAAYALIDAMMPESKKLNLSYPTLLTHDARLSFDEGNIEGFVLKYKEAYEANK
jgi:transcriptional regulator with XRE-family HTH domain